MVRWDGRRWVEWAVFAVLALATVLVLVGCGTESYGGPSPGPAPVEVGRRSKASKMPPALRASYLAARQKDGGEAYRFARGSSGGASGRNEAHRIEVALEEGSLRVRGSGADGWHMGLRWTGLGRGARVAAMGRPVGEAEVVENHGSYRRADGSEEQYVNGLRGVEQGFVLASPPGGGGEALAIEVAVEGDLAPVLMEGGVGVALRDKYGATVARYTDLAAFDADGVERRSWLEVAGGIIRLRIEDEGARYPLRVDPMISTQQAELTASDEAACDWFGSSVSVNGSTAIVGAPQHQVDGNDDEGAAYVFVQSGATWAQQAKLTASDGAAGDGFGSSVSVNGGTAIVGAPHHDTFQTGKAYVFVQSGTTWTQQAELSASDDFGWSVSVSDGSAIVGAPGGVIGNVGAAYVFVKSGITWTQQAMLKASDGGENDAFGWSVSVSGGTAIVGAPGGGALGVPGDSAGAAYVFAQSGSAWTQQAELKASDGVANDQFGTSASVSGGTAIIGAPDHQTNGNADAGSAYMFVQNGTTWTQQAELTACDSAADDYFGSSVSVSGGTAIVCAFQHLVGNNNEGAAYVFVQNGTTWPQQAELTTSNGAGDDFGSSVSVSGGTAIVGAYGNDSCAGAAYVFDSGGASDASGDSCVGTTNFYACASAPAQPPASPLAPAAIGALLGLAARRRRRRGHYSLRRRST